jgi:hypothetical protein
LRREVGRRDVPGDLQHVVDRVVAEVDRVLPYDLLARSVVDAVGHHRAVVAHDDVPVLPDDLGVLVLDRHPGAASDLGHLVGRDVESAND